MSGLGFASATGLPFDLPAMSAPVINMAPAQSLFTEIASEAGNLLRRVPAPAWIAAGALFIWWYTGRSSKRQAKAQAKREHERKLAQIDEQYSTGGRVRRAGRKAKGLIPKVSF